MKKTLVIGAQNIDLYARASSEYQLHDSNISRINLAFGGVASNIATNLSILGNEVELITVFGDDQFGKLAKQNLDQLKINYSESLIAENSRNSVYLGVMDKYNDLFLGLNDMEIISQLDVSFFREKTGYIESFDLIVADNNLSIESLQYLLTTFKHKTIIMDAVSAVKAVKLHPLLSNIDVLKVNMLELAALSDKENITGKLNEMLNLGVSSILLTNSDKEINYISKDKHVTVMPIQIDKIENATGAGDAFLSGFIHELMREESIEKCLETARQVANRCLQSPNATIQQNTGN